MRLWSLHPRYLDTKGLLALWREGLLAQAVLLGRTRGYRHHPQLVRFRAASDPAAAIGAYLREVAEEAAKRGYRFDQQRIVGPGGAAPLTVNVGQLEFEWHHLMAKLARRSPRWAQQWLQVALPDPHPLFQVIPGPREEWEKGSEEA
ncbi:MAG: pyrimidine dimer DNA glycosylase/endonuclease V [Thermoanaerobaculum sp.]|nr:pyrimidine dimer DNA glycosylase/endonuclease V [Thermoanaerobaculum sp.]